MKERCVDMLNNISSQNVNDIKNETVNKNINDLRDELAELKSLFD